MIQLWALKYVAGLVLVIGAAGYGYHHGVMRERARTDARVAEAEANARAITAQRFKTMQESQDAEFIARQQAQRDATSARAAVVSLRQQANQFASSLPDNPSAACSCETAESRARVLADLLGSATERASQLASEADSARIAGQLCASAYDSLTR